MFFSLDKKLEDDVIKFLDETIPAKYHDLQKERLEYDKLARTCNPLVLDDATMDYRNARILDIANSMLFFYEPLQLWMIQIRPAIKEMEPLSVYIQKHLEKELQCCNHQIVEVINDTAEFHRLHGKAVKRSLKHEKNHSYVMGVCSSQNVRIQSIRVALESMSYNLYYIYYLFKANWSHLKGTCEKSPHLFT